MKRVVIYTPERGGRGLNLEDLERIVGDARDLGIYLDRRPTVEVEPTRPGQRVGEIRRVRIEG